MFNYFTPTHKRTTGGSMAASRPKRKCASVTFVGDDDVVQHIVDAHDRKTVGKKTRRVSDVSGRKKSKLEEEKEAEEDNDVDGVFVGQSAALSVDEDQLFGGDVYQFRTPKKSGQMAQKATESKTPKSILKTPKHSTGTPRKSVNFTPVKEDDTCTPKRSRQPLAERKIKATTPYRLRKRNCADDSDTDDSDDSVDEDSDEDSNDEETETHSGQSKSQTPQRKYRRKTEEIEISAGMVEEYFDIHRSAGPTSDRTLSKLETPRMDQEALNAVLCDVPQSHLVECKQLYEENRGLFNGWMYQMCNGFNILLYGLGSKRSLLEDFRTTMLKDFSHLVINGYFPSLTIKHILNCITDEILEHEGSFKGYLDQCDFIRAQFENKGEDFYLIIHNIDGAMLRNEKTQNTLSLLSQIPGFHLLASVDHINSSLIWDQSKCSRFNWLWYDVTSYVSYSHETSYENSLLVQQSGALALSSLTHVMRSLTPNAKGIFMLLAKYQLENKDNSLYIGMSFQDLYQRCRESFLVNSDLTLNTQLTEFRDHKMIRSKKSYDGVEHLMIPLDAATLTEFLEQQEDT